LSAPNYAAKVNGVEIASNDVREAYQRQLAQYERQANTPLDDVQRASLKKRVLEDFVNGEALATRADELGYRVSDRQVLDEMAQYPQLQIDGKFDYAYALSVLKAQGRSVSQIENAFRRDVKLRELDKAISSSSFATESEVKRFLELTRQQRELAWLTLSAAKYAADATPDDAAVKAYYDAHKPQYMTPETVNVRYVELSLPELASKVNVDDAQLKAYYDEQKAKTPERYVQPEQRQVRHILLQVADPKDDAAVKAKAEGILKRAQSGEDFAKLAQEFSQDPGSAQKGGDLGWADRKAYVGPFADAAFGMKEGEINGPVKTQFGYHILKLEGIRPTAVKTFEQAKNDLTAEYRQSEAERMCNDAQDQLADAALQNTSDIDVVARKAGLQVHDIPNFSRTDGGGDLGKSPAVLQAAFSQDVLDGHLSPIVELGKGRGGGLRGQAAHRRRVVGQRRQDPGSNSRSAEVRRAVGSGGAARCSQDCVRWAEARGAAGVLQCTLDQWRCGRGAGQCRAGGAERRFEDGGHGGPARIRASLLGRGGAGLRSGRAGGFEGDIEFAGARLVLPAAPRAF
jgi:peptidyl-prolyl cis-trans isomerase D